MANRPLTPQQVNNLLYMLHRYEADPAPPEPRFGPKPPSAGQVLRGVDYAATGGLGQMVYNRAMHGQRPNLIAFAALAGGGGRQPGAMDSWATPLGEQHLAPLMRGAGNRIQDERVVRPGTVRRIAGPNPVTGGRQAPIRTRDGSYRIHDTRTGDGWVGGLDKLQTKLFGRHHTPVVDHVNPERPMPYKFNKNVDLYHHRRN